MRMRLGNILLLLFAAMISMGTVAGYGYWGEYNYKPYTYEHSGFNTYGPYSWYNNPYGASVSSYDVYDSYGMKYGTAYGDLNMANGMGGYDSWRGGWVQRSNGWPWY